MTQENYNELVDTLTYVYKNIHILDPEDITEEIYDVLHEIGEL